MMPADKPSPVAPQGREQSEAAQLLRAGFRDPAVAWEALSTLGLDLPQAIEWFGEVADPDLALQSLQRLVEADHGGRDLLVALAAHPGLRARLLGVLGVSVALADHLVTQPADWRQLADDAVTAVRPSLFGLERQLLAAVGAPSHEPPPWGSGGARATGSDPAVLDALQAAYRRCLLALAARDLSGAVSVADVAAELADLAAATLSAGLAVALSTLPPGAARCRLAVIAMGKCGGRELNYVSDVDVVFVGEALPGHDEQAAMRTATRLATELMRVCGQVAWPVDAALRPEGRAGPLVRTLAGHQAYYARWAKTWEFQALLKARPVAGDLSLGRRYSEAVAPLVWTAGDRPDFVADVQAMRRRVEQTLPSSRADREVKLGRGGLRDVEFAVQLLQLVHGRTDVDIRSGTTLTALRQLADGGYVGREDARHLAEAYRWLRTVEHRLQLYRLRRTHLLPADDDLEGLRRVARAIGYRGDVVPLFARERAGYRREVRRLHEKLFYRPLLGAVARVPAAEAGLTPHSAGVRLTALGFDDPTAALRHLGALTAGVSRRAAIQRTLLPAMVGWFAAGADPDAGLRGYRQVSDALGTTPWYLRLLRDDGAVAERLAMLLSTSRYVADLLVRAPEGVRLLSGEQQLQPRGREALTAAFVAAVRRRRDWEATVATARGLRRQELLRVASADVLGVIDTATVGRALSDISAAVVQAALTTAIAKIELERRAPLPVRLAVIAMGRTGGLEQSYGSDVDVLFVHDPLPDVPEPLAAGVARDVANETRRLLALPAPDPPLVIDADLRPEGRQGPLTRSRASYAGYYARWSLVWEAQALLRAAPLAGDAALAEEFLTMIEPVRYPPGGLSRQQTDEVRRVKGRVEAERMPKGVDRGLALKLGRGGLADVEWTVQLLQLQHAHALPGLRTTSTLGALRAAAAGGLLSAGDADVLASAWTLAARTRDALVLVRGKPAVALPAAGRELDGVARCLGYPAGAHERFLADYRQATAEARDVVQHAFYG